MATYWVSAHNRLAIASHPSWPCQAGVRRQDRPRPTPRPSVVAGQWHVVGGWETGIMSRCTIIPPGNFQQISFEFVLLLGWKFGLK